MTLNTSVIFYIAWKEGSDKKLDLDTEIQQKLRGQLSSITASFI